MADRNRTSRAGVDERLGLLTETYRGLLAHYAEIERLSEAERRILAERGPIAEVNDILRRKQEILREVRDEEGRVMGAREWWKKIRRTLPPERGRELLSLLDAISRRVERSLAIEAECRELLSQATAWRRGAATPTPAATTAAAGNAATAAYGRSTPTDREVAR